MRRGPEKVIFHLSDTLKSQGDSDGVEGGVELALMDWRGKYWIVELLEIIVVEVAEAMSTHSRPQNLE